MGKAGKRQEMVEDRCAEMHIEVRCAKEFRVKVLLVKGVCVKVCKSGVCDIESCVKLLWVKEWCGRGAGVKMLFVQVLRGSVCVQVLCVKELSGTEVSVCVYHLHRCKTSLYCRGPLGNIAVSGQ